MIRATARGEAPSREAADYDRRYQRIAVSKAFVGLMEEDEKLSREAAAWITPYAAELEFGNDLDAFRKTGEAIYHISLVYDWCRPFFSADEAKAIRTRLLELAEDLSIGWPPFRQIVTNGHGNEDQLNRNLLAMAIALYGEEDRPYRYCAYRLWEELAPLRNLEYRSGCHNQGVSYGVARFGYEMTAAHLIRRMAGVELFDPVAKKLGYFWLYARLPDGTMLLDGDMSLGTRFWRYPDQFFLLAAYAEDPVLLGEFERQGGEATDPMLYLLLHDPELKPECDRSKLPLTRYFTGVLPGMIVRTGWNMGPESRDAVVEFKGGGEAAGNHQHADAGAFQIYYRGVLATDLGMYGFYGVPYDFDFAKRSIAHNVLLVYDPQETFQRNAANDGGQRFNQNCPANLQDLRRNARYRAGKLLNGAFGPEARQPLFNYLKCDLREAYSGKVRHYTRTFCFVRHDQGERPGTLIVFDRIRSARPELKKYWLLNTLARPETTGGRHRVRSGTGTGDGMLTTTMLLPEHSKMTVAGGGEAHRFFGVEVVPAQPNAPQAQGYRTMFSPREAQCSDRFLAVMQIHDAGVAVPEVTGVVADETVTLDLGDTLVVLGVPEPPTRRSFVLDIPDGRKRVRVLMADVAPGVWSVTGNGAVREMQVGRAEGCGLLTLDGGRYEVQFRSHSENQ